MSEEKGFPNETDFDKIAPFYDPAIKLLFLPLGGERRYRRRLLKFLSPQTGEKILDLGCGTGTNTLELARFVGNGKVIGIDISSKMIEVAQKKLKQSGLTNLQFVKGTSHQLPFENNSFDKILTSFALHEMEENIRLATLKEVNRVLKPQGELFVIELHLPPSFLARNFFKLFMKLEEEKAWKFLKQNLREIFKQSGFTQTHQELWYRGAIQAWKCKK